MADQADSKKTEHPKSPHAEREESILAFWKEQGIFEKSLNKPAPKGEFVFYEGPPGANGRPHIGHFESRAFKDAIPRYKTMRGYRVRRRGGWDTHGLPVELQAEKELGIRSKKEIDAYGIEEFNSKCKEIVWTYVREWEELTERMAFWVDLKNAYVTYKPNFIESVWNIVKHVDHEKLLYKDYKVVPWCPRCGTALSSHELAQGYETVKDLSVYVKLKVKSQKSKVESEKPGDTYLLAWTTTPWTLPGNVGLAVNEKIEYVKIKDLFIGEPVKEELNGLTPNVSETMSQFYILAKDRFESVRGHFKNPSIVETFKGKDLIGTEYEPLYPFLKDNVSGAEKEKLTNAFKVYAGDFVTTEDGTGIVHMAPMYGQDDFELGTRVGLPKYHLVNDDGTFKKEAGFLAGKFVKDDEAVAVEIIKDLAYRGLLFYKEKYEHTYPFCWRCHTPLIYFARDSWYIAMSKLRDKLVRENEGIHWEPEHIKEGRFGEWLREVKDWAISRERYWGTPLPVWLCEKCGVRRVVGSVEEIARKPKNEYWIMRHGEAEFNAKGLLNSDANVSNHLTEVGKQKIAEHLAPLKGEGIDLIFASPFMRTQESARIVQKMFGLADEQFITDDRLQEMALGKWNGKPLEGFMKEFPMDIYRFSKSPVGVETYAEVKKRMGDFLYDIESKYSGKKILIVSHGSPTMMLIAAAHGWDREQTIAYELNNYIQKGHYKKVDFRIVPHNPEYELDLHRPYIDDTKLACSCGGDMKRVKEVMDVWFDSGAMPFAQDHYPFESKVENQESHGLLSKIFGHEQKLAYPADFISEAIDQTRGWFYTLHAVGTLMGMGKAYKNVICLGHILDADGKKMSKSLGNVVNPFEMMDKYGADALRFWMYSVNQPGESKNFDEKTVDEVVKKVFNLALNVTSFYKMYEHRPKVESHKSQEPSQKSKVKSQKSKVTSDTVQPESQNVLDRWIVSRMNQLIEAVTKGMDAYVFLEPTRAIRDFVADLSQWYLRRSRDRFKGDDEADKQSALNTTRWILLTLAKVMAPFTPFFSEYAYKEVGGELESVHLTEWPAAGAVDEKLLKEMEIARQISSKGLEARNAAKINVRQPLASFSTTSAVISLGEIIKDELNVKEIVFGATEDKLDTDISAALKEEGDLRELLRKIQDLRKEKGLKVSDIAVLVVPAELKSLVNKFEAEIKKATNLTSIEEGATLGLAA